MNMLNIGKDFSPYPSGRFQEDGPASGELFREACLWPRIEKLQHGERLNIVLDDEVEGYGSSFLTEGFAGIVKYGYMRPDILLSKLEFSFTDTDFDFYKNKIIQYIGEAEFESKKYVRTKV